MANQTYTITDGTYQIVIAVPASGFSVTIPKDGLLISRKNNKGIESKGVVLMSKHPGVKEHGIKLPVHFSYADITSPSVASDDALFTLLSGYAESMTNANLYVDGDEVTDSNPLPVNLYTEDLETSLTHPAPVGGHYDATPGPYTDGDEVPLHFDTQGNLKVTGASSVSAEYTSPNDFSAAYLSSTTITLTGLSIVINDSSQIVYIKFIPSAGSGAGIIINGSGGATITHSGGVLTVDGAATPFASGDVYEVGINGQRKAHDANDDVTKTAPQSYVPKPVTDAESYDTFVLSAVTYTKGTVIDTADTDWMTFYYSNSGSDLDDIYVRIIGLLAVDGTVDYQETYFGAPVAGEITVTPNLYVIDKAASVDKIVIPIDNPFTRIDCAKKTDTGTDPTLTTFITKSPRV